MDGMSPFPRNQADARYDLARLCELLPRVGQSLAALGIAPHTATAIGEASRALRQDIAAAREALPVSRSVLG